MVIWIKAMHAYIKDTPILINIGDHQLDGRIVAYINTVDGVDYYKVHIPSKNSYKIITNKDFEIKEN